MSFWSDYSQSWRFLWRVS